MAQILVCNCGSSSLKVDVFLSAANGSQLAAAAVSRIGSEQTELKLELFGTPPSGQPSKGADGGAQLPEVRESLGALDHEAALRLVVSRLEAASVFLAGDRFAVGHRVVHGAHYMSAPALIDADVQATIERCSAFAPLHNPANLKGIRAALELFAVPQVAVFDTAFHATIDPAAYSYAIPRELAAKHELRRYGFHGTSHEYVGRLVAARLGKSFDQCRIISLHLGNGASACAIQNGRSVETSMGFTPLEGLIMGTRCGDLDPAVVLFLQEREGLNAAEIDLLLNKRSGLLGLSGHSDMRDLLAAADSGDADAVLARDAFCHRLRKYVGAYLAVLGGADAIVYTAGIGEHSPEIRSRSLKGMEQLGIKLDEERNRRPDETGRISSIDSAIPLYVIATDEERMIATQTYELISGKGGT